MSNLPRTITLISKNTRKRRIVHLMTVKNEKSFKSASAKCNIWVLNNNFPIILKVSYGESSNEMVCCDIAELRYGLQAFVKEYMD
jgi:hypothetical protein